MEDADGAAWQRAAQLIPARSLRRASEFVHSTEFTVRSSQHGLWAKRRGARRALSSGDLGRSRAISGRDLGLAQSIQLARGAGSASGDGGRGLGAHVRSRYRWMVE